VTALRCVPFLQVSDARRSAEFYCDRLGFEREWEHQLEPGLPRVIALRLGAIRLFLTEHPESAAGALVYVYVADADERARAAVRAGAALEWGPVDQPWHMRELQVRDPDGNKLRFGQQLAEAAPGDVSGRLPQTTRLRLRHQLEAVPVLLARADADALRRRPPSGKWSAHENLAHLARHHEVMLGRLDRILAEDRPTLDRYRAEDDIQWPSWPGRGTEEVLESLRALRARLLARVEALGEAELRRTGLHPRFGEMTVPEWLEFFLVHEAHHLYVALGRVAESRGAA
jgi:catechol 2,3-dioxygenase-like lactoylglutathione lyase family enzyme